MTDAPLSMSAPMISALLEHRKSQTRRIPGRLRGKGAITALARSDTPGYAWHFRDRDMRWHDVDDARLLELLPWRAGGRLWVREACGVDERGGARRAWYRGGHPEERSSGPRTDVRWRPPHLMPRWASRITLHVQDVRVEHVKDISEAVAIAEGIFQTRDADRDGMRHFAHARNVRTWPTAVLAYRALWEDLHGQASWHGNPVVTVTTFRTVLANIDATEGT